MMYAVMRCQKDKFSTEFGHLQWTILYGSTYIYLICIMVYKLLGKFEPYMFWRKGCRILRIKPLNGIQGLK